MGAIVTGRTCRRNGMANIFAGVDVADIEYLRSLTAAPATSLAPNLTGAHVLSVSHDVTSRQSEDDCSDNENDGSNDNTTRDSQDYRWYSLFGADHIIVRVFGAAQQHDVRSHLLGNKSSRALDD